MRLKIQQVLYLGSVIFVFCIFSNMQLSAYTDSSLLKLQNILELEFEKENKTKRGFPFSKLNLHLYKNGCDTLLWTFANPNEFWNFTDLKNHNFNNNRLKYWTKAKNKDIYIISFEFSRDPIILEPYLIFEVKNNSITYFEYFYLNFENAYKESYKSEISLDYLKSLRCTNVKFIFLDLDCKKIVVPPNRYECK